MSQKEKLTVYPASKLGEYTVIQDIAEGTFGKVKSKLFLGAICAFGRSSCDRPQWPHIQLRDTRSL